MIAKAVCRGVKGACQSWSRRQTHLTSCVLLSLNVPVAVNCLMAPTAMLEFAGVTAIETKFAPVNVRDAVPLTEPEVAVMVATPVPRLVARPVESTPPRITAELLPLSPGSPDALLASRLPFKSHSSPRPPQTPAASS